MRLFRHYTFVDYATQGYQIVVALLVLLFHNRTVPHWEWLLLSHLAGLLLCHGIVAWHGRVPHQPVVSFFRHFYPVLLYTWFFCETGMLNRMFVADYMDPLVIGWDQAIFGSQPSVWLMQKAPWLAISELFYASYFSYYLMIAGVGIALFLRDRRHFFHYVSVVSFVFYVCYLVYIFLPVIGPRVFFREIAGYALPPDVQQLGGLIHTPESIQQGLFYQIMRFIYATFEAPGAAFPSSHVAVALCTVYFSYRYLRVIWVPHMVVTILLCISTVYCRYHYVVDVFAGVATVAVLLPAGNWLYFRFRKGGSARGTADEEPRVTPELDEQNDPALKQPQGRGTSERG